MAAAASGAAVAAVVSRAGAASGAVVVGAASSAVVGADGGERVEVEKISGTRMEVGCGMVGLAGPLVCGWAGG